VAKMQFLWGHHTVLEQEARRSFRAAFLLLIVRVQPGTDITKLTPQDEIMIRTQWDVQSLKSKLSYFLDGMLQKLMGEQLSSVSSHYDFNRGAMIKIRPPLSEPTFTQDGISLMTPELKQVIEETIKSW
jgi:hypothetical protein